MGKLSELWHKTAIGKAQAEKKAKALEEAELRKEVQAEVKEEVKKIIKTRMANEELAKAKGEKPVNEKKNAFATLADEFKNANVGTSDQMNKLLGKPTTGQSQSKGSDIASPEKITSLMSGRNTPQLKDYGNLMGGHQLNTGRDIGKDLGRERKLRNDYEDMIGLSKRSFEQKKADAQRVVGKTTDGEEKIKRMLGRR